MPQPEITVVLSTFNRDYSASGMTKTYLERAISSILNQTFTDFELILINDGSSDSSHSTCMHFASEDPRIRYVFHEKNSGLPAYCYNKGISMGRGQFYAFMFDDDEWFPHALASLHDGFISNSMRYPNLGMVYGLVEFFNTENNQMISPRFGNPWDLQKLQKDNFLANCAVLLKRDALNLVGAYDEHPDMRRICDWDLWQRVGLYFPVICLPEVIGRVNIKVLGSLECTVPLEISRVHHRQKTRTSLPLKRRNPSLKERLHWFRQSLFLLVPKKEPKPAKQKKPLRTQIVDFTKSVGIYKPLRQLYRRLIPFEDTTKVRSWENWEKQGVAEQIHQYWIGSPIELSHRMVLAQLVQKFYLPSESFLETGSGTGLIYNALVPTVINNSDYYGIDVSEKMLEIGRKAFPEARFEKNDLFNLTFPDNSFSFVAAFEVFGHLEAFRKPLREMYRVSSRIVLFTLWVEKTASLKYEQIGETQFLHHTYTHDQVVQIIREELGHGAVIETIPLCDTVTAYVILKKR